MEIRKSFHEELEQLRIQVELMGVKVDENLERMRQVVADGTPQIAELALAGCDRSTRCRPTGAAAD